MVPVTRRPVRVKIRRCRAAAADLRRRNAGAGPGPGATGRKLSPRTCIGSSNYGGKRSARWSTLCSELPRFLLVWKLLPICAPQKNLLLTFSVLITVKDVCFIFPHMVGCLAHVGRIAEALSAGLGGAFSSTCLYPIEICKNRLQAAQVPSRFFYSFATLNGNIQATSWNCPYAAVYVQ